MSRERSYAKIKVGEVKELPSSWFQRALRPDTGVHGGDLTVLSSAQGYMKLYESRRWWSIVVITPFS